MPRIAKHHTNGRVLMRREEMPEYLQESYGPFIVDHYRPQARTAAEALRTFFTLHNESVNVWSHALGFVIMFAHAIVFFWSSRALSSCWPMAVYLTGALYIMAVSTSAHLFCCMGKRTYDRVWKLDYTAITVVMFSMYVPWCVYLFDPLTAGIYLSFSGAIAFILVRIGLSDQHHNGTNQAVKPTMFIGFGLFGFAPVVHAANLYLNTDVDIRAAVYLTVLQLLMNMCGALAFGFRIPERFFRPGTFDLVGNGHNVMHVLSLGSLVVYYHAAAACLRFAARRSLYIDV